MKIKDPAHAIRVIDFMASRYHDVSLEPNIKDSPSYSRIAWLALSVLSEEWKTGPDGINGQDRRDAVEIKMDNVIERVASEMFDEMLRLGKVQDFEVPK